MMKILAVQLVGVKQDMDDACASAISSSSVYLVNKLEVYVC